MRVVACVLFALLLLPAPGLAVTRTVTTLADDGRAGSLRALIAQSGPGDIIDFAVTGTIALTGTLSIGRDLIINGPGAAYLAVSGNSYLRVFHVMAGVVTISGLTISDGSSTGADGADGAPGSPGQGGGIVNAGTLTLVNCILRGNKAQGGLGGRVNFVVSQDPGTAGMMGGGGEGGGVYSSGVLTLSNCTCHANESRGGWGSQGVPSTVRNGVGGKGGLASGGGIFSIGPLKLVNCTFVANVATGGYGGDGGYNPPVEGGPGGSGGDSMGGAIKCLVGFDVVNCTITLNQAVRGHTGLQVGGQPPPELSGHSVAGGVYAAIAASRIINTIIARNNALNGGSDISGTITSLGHNLIGDADGSSGWVASDLIGSGASPFDPELGPLQDNSGQTPTLALPPTSAAIDAGDDAVLSPPYNLTTDQRGRPRRVSDHVDIGAVEFDYVTRLVSTPQDTGGGSLRNAIFDANPFDRIVFAPVVRGKIRLTTTNLFINKPLTILGPGAAQLAISGNYNSRVFYIGPQGNVEIYGLTITEGRVVGRNGIDGRFDFDHGLTLPTSGENALGGGILNEGQLKLFDSMVVSNSVQGGVGGQGVDQVFIAVLNGEKGGDARGAGIYSSGFLELHRCTLLGHLAEGGGGGAGGPTWSTPGETAGGLGGEASGAGVHAVSIANLVNCTLVANRAIGGIGGAGPQTGVFPPFSIGVAGPGGLAAGGGLSGRFTLSSCTVSSNSVVGGAGGTGSSMGATGPSLAGGVNITSLDVVNTVVAGNIGSGSGPEVMGTVTSRGWNLIGITDGSSGWTTNDFLGHSTLPLNALLGPCQDSGGPVWTMCPLTSSPARDKGRSELATDARGGRRIVDFPTLPNAVNGNGSDIGALEVDSLFGNISITRTPTTSRVKFKTDPGNTYTLQQTGVLTNRNWTNLVMTLPGDGRVVEATDNGPLPPGRFYRVRSSPSP